MIFYRRFVQVDIFNGFYLTLIFEAFSILTTKSKHYEKKENQKLF